MPTSVRPVAAALVPVMYIILVESSDELEVNAILTLAGYTRVPETNMWFRNYDRAIIVPTTREWRILKETTSDGPAGYYNGYTVMLVTITPPEPVQAPPMAQAYQGRTNRAAQMIAGPTVHALLRLRTGVPHCVVDLERRLARVREAAPSALATTGSWDRLIGWVPDLPRAPKRTRFSNVFVQATKLYVCLWHTAMGPIPAGEAEAGNAGNGNDADGDSAAA